MINFRLASVSSRSALAATTPAAARRAEQFTAGARTAAASSAMAQVRIGWSRHLSTRRRKARVSVRPSMGSVGDPYDNAMAERFFAALEREPLNRRRFRTQSEATGGW